MISNFKDFITTYVGTYVSTGDTIANMDWEFIAGAVVLCILIITFFKSLRFVFRRFGK